MSSITSLKKYVFLFFLLILGGCHSENAAVQFKDYRYIISMTNILERGGKILFVDDKNSVKTSMNFDGQSIQDINQFDNSFYFHSGRINKHFRLDKDGHLSSYANSLNGDNDLAFASWVARKGDTTLIETINGGLQSEGYESAVIYSKNNVKKNVVLKGKIIEDIIEHNDLLYVATSYPGKDFGLSIVDMKTGAIKKEVVFNNRFLPGNAHFIKLNTKIVAHGSNVGLANFADDSKKSGLVSFDTNTFESIEFILPEGDLIYETYLYDGRIYAITEKGYLYQFDENLNIKEKEAIVHREIIDLYQSEDSSIADVVEESDKLHVLVKKNDEDNPKRVGKIYVLKKSNLEIVSSFEIIDSQNNQAYDILRFKLIK